MASNISELAERVRAALEAPDLHAYEDLLAPDVHWGPPGQPQWGCHNRREVLAWYEAARDNGARARIDEVVAGAGRILLGLTVPAPASADEDGGPGRRWQVLTINDGVIVDICGFDDRDAAAAHAGLAP